MASMHFLSGAHERVTKQLGANLSGVPQMTTIGSTQDQYKGLGESLKTAVVPFSSTSYSAHEHMLMRIGLNHPIVTYIDFVCPVLNIKNKSIQGVGTFVTHIPHPIGETYVTRDIWVTPVLLPHRLAVDEGRKPKDIIEGKLITSQAINEVNGDKRLRKSLGGRSTASVTDVGPPSSKYEVSFPVSAYPPGMFTVIPYFGSTIMVFRDAGGFASEVDSPDWDFERAFSAFSGVADRIARYPEQGELEGKIYLDRSLEILLPRLLEYLRGGQLSA